MNGLVRTLKHLFMPGWLARRAFHVADVAAIRAAITASESCHRGELRFVAEGPMSPARLFGGMSARQRAVELFGGLRVWDTAENNGILIYVQLVDRRVEVLADRAIAAKVAQAEWDGICREMETAFKAGAYRRGALDAIDRATRLLGLHFPLRGKRRNELPDLPLLL
jgi:uncharacterized membrane protein